MEFPQNVGIDTIKSKYLELLQKLHSLIQEQQLTSEKAIKEISIDDLLPTLLKEEAEGLSAVFNALKKRVETAKKKEIVWNRRRKYILEKSKSIGVILNEEALEELIFRIPYYNTEAFSKLLDAKIQQWKEYQMMMVGNMKSCGISAMIPDLNVENKTKFKVTAVFEVEYFKSKEVELVEMLKKRLQEANFKSIPDIKVENLVETKQLTMALD